MNARPRAFELLPSTIVATAALLGVLAALQPLYAVAATAALIVAYVVFNDLAMGFALLTFLSFIDALPTSSSLSPAKAVGFLLAAAWLARYASAERGERDLFADLPKLTWALVAFFVWAMLSLLWATSISASTTTLVRYAPNILLIPIAYTAIRTRRDVMLVFGAIVLGAIIAASFSFLQPPDPNTIEEGGRATGTVGDPNELAALLLVGLTLSTGLVLGKGRAPLLRLLAGFTIALCAGGIFLSLSRGGLIALGVVLVAGTFFAGRWRVALTVMLVTVAAGGVLYFTTLAPLPARERITTSNGGSGRSDIWKLGLRMFRAHPITGVGAGNFSVVSADYALQPGTLVRADLVFAEAPKITHNTYLQVLSEMGIPGLTFFLLAVLSSLACSFRAARLWAQRGQDGMEALARSVLLAMLGLLAADFFISQMYSKLLWVMLALGPVLLSVARSERDEPDALESAAT
jgi:O-antigen ligase